MADEKILPTIRLAHQRITSLQMIKSEIEALVIAEVIRRAATQGVVVNLTKGVETGAIVCYGPHGNVTVTITEDMTPDADK